ncbi:hypothetical protein ASD86_15140 [Lysobacter sp. Root690]|nr:hypothetical protein ASD86_15140 [Lysobacter sp. Root690]
MAVRGGPRTIGRALRKLLLAAAFFTATAHAQTAIYQDTFDSGSATPTSVVRITGYTGPAPNNVVYAASAAWTVQCNGWVASWNSPANAPAANPQIADCGSALTWHLATNLADTLGMYNLGITTSSAASRDNIALTAFTSGNPGNAAGNNTIIENTTPIPFPGVPPGGSGRFVTFRFTAAATSCASAHPLVTFSILNPTETQLGAQLDLCTGGVNAQTLASASHGEGPTTARVATYIPSGASGNVLLNGTSLRFRVRNQQASGVGNDWAWDNFTVLDVSPTVTKSDPGIRYVGVAKPLTFTITNTPQDNMSKVGWGFTDTLPANVVVAATPGAATTCGAGTTITAAGGANTIAVANGTLAAGTAGGTASSCTVTVNVVSNTAGSYTNAAANFTASTGLNLPPAPITMEWVLNRLTITKLSQGGIGTFGFSGNNGIANHSIATAVPGTGVAGAQQALTVASTTTNTTFSETTPSAAWAPASVTCAGLAAGQSASLAGATVTIPFAGLSLVSGGRDVACTVTNTLTSLTVVKRVVNDNGGAATAASFGLQSRAVRGTGPGGSNAITFSTPPVVAGNTSTYTSDVINFTPDANPEWLLESDISGYAEGSWSCTGAGVTQGGTAFDNGSFTIAAGSAATCTITNDDIAPRVTVTKVSNDGVGTFNFTGSNGFANQAITTLTAGTGVAGAAQNLAAAGVATTISEVAPPAGFALQSIACSGLGAGGTFTPTINGAAGGNVVLNAAATAPGSDIQCVFTNASNEADLSVVKTNNQTTLSRGSQTTYTVTVRNGGPAAANGSVVRDTPVSNLDNCSVIACVPVGATPAAACPATPGDLLTPAGAVLGPFAANSAVQFTVQCTVN